MSIFIVKVFEEGENFEYEYSNMNHARQHFDTENKAYLLEYNRGKYYFIDCK